MIPKPELQQAYENMLREFENEVEHERKIITGWKDIAKALNIRSKSGTYESDRKRFYRMTRQYNFPVHKAGKRIFMLQKDIDLLRGNYLFGFDQVSRYLGIHRKTIYRLLKKYPKMPIDRTRRIAYKPALHLWLAGLCLDRRKRGCQIPRFIRENTPIYEGILLVFSAMKQMRFSHTKEFKKYWMQSENDILRAS